MKYSEVIAQIPRLLQAKDAVDYCAGQTVLNDLQSKHGLKPIRKAKGLTVYDRNDIDDCIEKMKSHNMRSMSPSEGAK